MKRIVLIAVIIALVLLLVGYYLLSPLWKVVEVQEESPLVQVDVAEDAPIVLVQGNFIAQAHEVEGKAFLIRDGDSTILRFENFETVNGPDLHIWLASSLGKDDYIDLGPIKATKGNVNYDVPDGVDTAIYNKVLVWCIPFSVLFSYAELG